MYIFLILAVLSLRAVLAAGMFYLLVDKKAGIRDCLRLTVVSSALNKLLVSASGFIAGSYCSRFHGLTAPQALGAFLIIEILSVTGWVLLAVYSGAHMISYLPVYICIVVLCAMVVVYFKRTKVLNFWIALQDQMAGVRRNLIWCGLYAGLDMLLFAVYYKLLFLYFGINLLPDKILSVISLSFTAGYLSPSPSGLGFKDAALAGLLLKEGVGAAMAALVVLMDRLLMTGFWLAAGFLISADLLKQFWAGRRMKK